MEMTDAERQVYEEEIDAAYDEMWKAKRNFILALIFALVVLWFLFLAQVKLHQPVYLNYDQKHILAMDFMRDNTEARNAVCRKSFLTEPMDGRVSQ